MICPTCNKETGSRFCPDCGTAIIECTHTRELTKIELGVLKANSKGIAGCAGVLLILVGGLLCLTVIGSIFGIPLIIAGILSFFGVGSGSLSAKKYSVIGSCPACGFDVAINTKKQLNIKCPRCKRTIYYYEGTYINPTV